MNTKYLALLASLIALASLSASAGTVTYSGTALAGLTYTYPYGPPTDAQYVPAAAPTPALAALYTSDSGDLVTSGDDPAVFIQGPLGTLGGFSASYGLYGTPTGPTGTSPYWILWANAPGDNNPNDEIAVIGMGGATLGSTDAIHVWDPNSILGSYWGDTLSQLDATVVDGTTFGNFDVDWAGVEIGNWDNGDAIISASANFDSLTINSSAPDGAPTLLLLGLGLAGLGVLGLRRNRLQLTK